MKKTVGVFLVFAFSLVSVVGGLHAQQLTLDQVIKRAARGIEEALPQSASVAVLNFASPAEAFSDYVIEELTGELVTGRKLTIVDRRSLALISQEMNLQLSGDVSDESAQAIGRMLGAQSIVSGTLTNMGTFHRFRIRVIKVETAAIQTQVSLDLQNNAQVAFLLSGSPPTGGTAPAPASAAPAQTPAAAPSNATHKVGDKGPAGGLIFYSTEPRTSSVPPPVSGTFNVGATGPAGGVVFYPVATTTTAPKATDKVYRIGETGPAGGIIFYVNPGAGPWKYLEAAPSDISQKLYACREDIPFKTERTVGSGKLNTEAIMREANSRGGGFGWAAQACDALVVNGFDDWFLPSRDELHYMYGSLRMQGLGGFSSDWYWSSTYENPSYHWKYFYAENFSDGDQEIHSYDNQFRVRAIRQF